MKRVQREKCGHQSAAPERARLAQEERKEQKSDGNVEGEIDEVVASGIQTEEAAIRHVGYPSKGMPVAGVTDVECPFQSGPGETRSDVAIVENVFGVVEADKVVLQQPQVGEEGCDSEEQTDANGTFLERS